MRMPSRYEPMESYSSYKKRMNEKTVNKIKKIITGIDQLSLNPKDKLALKRKCKESINL